ncbi:MAG: hypothetical protein L6R39_000003 [Caloplaca ligustica]|nr:MAG: hypothetical protein L6R39_000003 [Caloplaca ligustica]
MATRGFPLTKYSLILSSRWIGSVWVIGPARSESASNNTTTELVGENDTQAIRLADSGRIIDANDPTVAINFHYTGRSISSKDYFEVLMQAAVILAYDGPSRPFQILHAINHAGTVVLNINAFHGQGEHPAKKIGTSLLLVLQARLAGRSFDGLEFTVMIGHPDHRQAVAQGSIFRLTPHQPPGGEVATAK